MSGDVHVLAKGNGPEFFFLKCEVVLDQTQDSWTDRLMCRAICASQLVVVFAVTCISGSSLQSLTIVGSILATRSAGQKHPWSDFGLCCCPRAVPRRPTAAASPDPKWVAPVGGLH